MEFLVVCLVALIAAALTLFSGFGLGTLLMPAFALVFPLPLAVAATAVVHLANNLFKFALLGRRADRAVLLRFAPAAILAAFLGAACLRWIGEAGPLAAYRALGRDAAVTPLGLTLGALILGFALFEAAPAAARFALPRRWLPLGGALSGFFGGLSGHQGALRSLFLLRAGLDKDAFVATGVVIAVLVDLARTTLYGVDLFAAGALAEWPLLAAATASAWLGSFFGARLLGRATYAAVQRIVTGLLILVGIGIGAGLL